jgi:hypothetical protein
MELERDKKVHRGGLRIAHFIERQLEPTLSFGEKTFLKVTADVANFRAPHLISSTADSRAKVQVTLPLSLAGDSDSASGVRPPGGGLDLHLLNTAQDIESDESCL